LPVRGVELSAVVLDVHVVYYDEVRIAIDDVVAPVLHIDAGDVSPAVVVPELHAPSLANDAPAVADVVKVMYLTVVPVVQPYQRIGTLCARLAVVDVSAGEREVPYLLVV
jgi:hypothetical protein